jgi:hypothetical protein
MITRRELLPYVCSSALTGIVEEWALRVSLAFLFFQRKNDDEEILAN